MPSPIPMQNDDDAGVPAPSKKSGPNERKKEVAEEGDDVNPLAPPINVEPGS
ncbi:hypothetical protein [Sphingobium yanoikuyae]|uniref:hypothetical protein n=1 Tax=Sphingobium yanoikuyae TaxID=13690 RepID=UPI0015529F88|nr:hypothetical protein [Sphingobium yanoikuyae]